MVSSSAVTNFTWSIHDHLFSYPLRLLQNEGCDIILGGDWLKTCTPIKYDYDRMVVTLRVNGKKIKLQTHSSTAICSFISYQSLHSLMSSSLDNEIEEVFLITTPKLDEQENIKLTQLLEEYSDLFQEPKGLPPVRGTDHQILLKPGSIPKHQYPYRVSHDHKDEIEKIV